MRKRSKCAFLATAMAATTILAAGCGNSASGGQNTADSAERVPIRWLTTGDAAAEAIQDNDRIIEAINEKLGIDLTVEIVPEAIENAKKNAALNGISNTSFYCGAAEDVVTDMVAKRRTPSKEGTNGALADVVVVDPPRKGCDAKLLDTIVAMNPEKIVYVSCDPATLARDVKVLGEKGYEVKKVRACDMFPQGGHVETVVGLQRKDM